ncbi:MDR family MFS transporter [Nonomuraea sp. NPDC003709]|uniref:MDR family MFS transporter n=1 Tax=Nonomuraea sp. NPDC003709 TaxID=3154450 RepID=UPI00339DE1BF
MSVRTFDPPRAGATRSMMVVLVPLMLVLFISNLDQTIVATALPSIGRDLNDLSGAPWIATSYLLTTAVSTLILGKLGDMYGRKRIFQVSIIVFLAGSVLCGLSGDLLWLVLFRGLQGIGGGGLNSLVMAIIGDVAPPKQRSKYQAALGVVATLALISGPLLGGVFSDDLSWRWIFFINIPVGALAVFIVGARLHLPRPADRQDRRVDVLGGVVVSVFTTTVLLFTTWGGTKRAWDSPVIVSLIAVSAVTLIAYLVIEARAPEAITPLRLFTSSVFNISAIQFLLATMVLFVAMLYTPLFLQTVQHKSAFDAGLYVIPLLIGLVAATSVAGARISKTGGYKWYPPAGAVITGVSMWGMSRADAHTGAIGLIAALFFAGIGIGFFVQVALLSGQNAADYSDLGVATGTLNFFKSLGGAFGAALFGTILTHAMGHAARPADAFHTVFLWTLPFMVLALLLGLVMREKPLSEEMVQVVEGKIEVPEY